MANEVTSTTAIGPHRVYHRAQSNADAAAHILAERLAEGWCRSFQEERPSMRLRLEEWLAIREGLVAAYLHGHVDGRGDQAYERAAVARAVAHEVGEKLTEVR